MILWLLLRIVNDLRLLRSFTNHATDWDGTTFIKNPFNPLNNGFISTNNGSSILRLSLINIRRRLKKL